MHSDGQRANVMEAANMRMLLEGLASSTADSAHFLRQDGQRLRATRALDDARRAARVLKEAATDAWQPIALEGYETVQSARHALQMGQPERAELILENGSERLRAAAASTTLLTSGGGLRLGTVTSIQKVRLIDARGAVLGRVELIERRPNGPSEAVLKVGGVTHLFGFLDYGNERITVPADHLVFGKKMAALSCTVTNGLVRPRSALQVRDTKAATASAKPRCPPLQ
jgi:hypothetical protein